MKSLFGKIEGPGSIGAVAVILRATFFIVMFPHGAQLLLGWFGGYGYSASVGYFSSIGLPAIVGFLVIFLEFFGSIFILLGLFTRLVSFASFFLVLGMVLMVHAPVGFFMNWYGNLQGEGFEYHILMIGLLLALISTGGGKPSLDAMLFHSTKQE